jgi:Arc/MetJ family transcription regulator
MCMRTNIEIDDHLMREVLRLTGLGTKRAAVDFAMRELVARHQQLGVLKLRGRIQWEGDLDVSRQGRVGEPRPSARRDS